MNQSDRRYIAPALDTVAWINTLEPLILSALKGKVVVIHAFQMLCPGCVAHGIPQATRIQNLYAKEDVQVIGLHTVFEHHDVMTIDALKVFVKEYRITFPIGIDTPSDSGFIPKTMASYQMQGTPTLVVLDKLNRVRLNHFGRISDLQVGSLIGSLLVK
jgi:thiol-disulfide isomerase/thioredoxin